MGIRGTTLVYLESSEEIERLAAAQTGDVSAYMELVRQYARPLYRSAFAITRDARSASRLTRDAFAHGWRGIRELPESERVYPWLLRIARSLVPTPPPDSLPEGTASEQTAEEDARMLAAYRALRPDEQAIYSLRLLERLPYEEIAGILDLALAVATLRLAQARGHMLERISASGATSPAETEQPAGESGASETGSDPAMAVVSTADDGGGAE